MSPARNWTEPEFGLICAGLRSSLRVRFLLAAGRVGDRTASHRFSALRRHVVSRIAALTFIALVLIPFTAPFPTYLLTHSSSHPYDALPKDIKDKVGSDDIACAPPIYLVVELVLVGDVAVRAVTRRPADDPRRNLILRL